VTVFKHVTSNKNKLFWDTAFVHSATNTQLLWYINCRYTATPTQHKLTRTGRDWPRRIIGTGAESSLADTDKAAPLLHHSHVQCLAHEADQFHKYVDRFWCLKCTKSNFSCGSAPHTDWWHSSNHPVSWGVGYTVPSPQCLPWLFRLRAMPLFSTLQHPW